MKLIRAVRRLEAGAAEAARAGELVNVGLVWTEGEDRVDLAALQPGELVACDVTVAEVIGGTPLIRIHERVTREVNDLGVVCDFAGRRVGLVVAIDGNLLSIRPDAGEVWPPAGPEPAAP